jgi:hypothetical protein
MSPVRLRSVPRAAALHAGGRACVRQRPDRGHRLDGGPQEPVPEATTIQERPNSPLFVRGNVTIFGPDHTLVRQDTRGGAVPVRRIGQQAVLRRQSSQRRVPDR